MGDTTVTRITLKRDLEQLTRRINAILEQKTDTYLLSYAYGGVSLHRRGDGGGITDVFGSGHIPKRELHGRISSFIDGLHTMRHTIGVPKYRYGG